MFIIAMTFFFFTIRVPNGIKLKVKKISIWVNFSTILMHHHKTSVYDTVFRINELINSHGKGATW